MIRDPATIQSKADFLAFMAELSADLMQNEGTWENATIERFLEALASWVEDSDGFYRNSGRPLPTDAGWRLVAEVLAAARIYE